MPRALLSIIGWFSNRTGTSVGDGKARRKDWTQLLVPNLPLCHWSSQVSDLRAPSSTDVPVLLLNQANLQQGPKKRDQLWERDTVKLWDNPVSWPSNCRFLQVLTQAWKHQTVRGTARDSNREHTCTFWKNFANSLASELNGQLRNNLCFLLYKSPFMLRFWSENQIRQKNSPLTQTELKQITLERKHKKVRFAHVNISEVISDPNAGLEGWVPTGEGR